MALFILPDYSFYEAMAATKRPTQSEPKLLHTFWRSNRKPNSIFKSQNREKRHQKIGKSGWEKPKGSAARAIKMHFYEQNYQQA